MSRRERRKSSIKNPRRLKKLRQFEMLRLGGQFRRFRFSATENTISGLSEMPEAPELHRLPGYFISEMPEGRFYENGLEPPDALIFRMLPEVV